MFNLGAGEIVLILVIALLVLGPKRLPELARGIGKFMREFRRQTDEVRSVVEREFYRMDQELNVDPTTGDLVQGQGPRAPLPAPPAASGPPGPENGAPVPAPPDKDGSKESA